MAGAIRSLFIEGVWEEVIGDDMRLSTGHNPKCSQRLSR